MDKPFCDVKIKFVIPFFTGILCSLVFCALIGHSHGIFAVTEPLFTAESEPENVYEADEYEYEEFIFTSFEKIPDIVLEYYRNPEYRGWVIEFFTGLCSSREIAEAILNYTDEFDVPPALAFALSWEESRFNPDAVNRSNRDGSIDRGLFQLNSRSFPNIAVNVFFEIDVNARYGVGHLRQCLDSGASDVSALAMYNAGTTRVRSTGAPEVTLNYISRILENRGRIESHFHSRLIREEEFRLASRLPDAPSQIAEAAAENTAQFFLGRTLINASPLKPSL